MKCKRCEKASISFTFRRRDSGGGLTLAQAVQIAYRVQRRALFGRPEVARPCSHNALKMADEAATFLEARTIDREEREKQYWVSACFGEAYFCLHVSFDL